MTIYGIKTCSTVGKARKYMREHNLDYEFVDYKTDPVGEEKIRQWLEHVDIDILFNSRGKKYRDLGLKELDLDYNDKISWMAKENYLIKRPVIEYGDDSIIVGFEEEIYKKEFV